MVLYLETIFFFVNDLINKNGRNIIFKPVRCLTHIELQQKTLYRGLWY